MRCAWTDQPGWPQSILRSQSSAQTVETIETAHHIARSKSLRSWKKESTTTEIEVQYLRPLNAWRLSRLSRYWRTHLRGTHTHTHGAAIAAVHCAL